MKCLVISLLCLLLLQAVQSEHSLFQLIEDDSVTRAFATGKLFPDKEHGSYRTRGIAPASTWIDYDGDGDSDVFLVAMQGVNSLYRCDGVGIYTRITTGDIVADVGPSTSVSWGDVDNDGDLDAYVTFDKMKNALYLQTEADMFERVSDPSWGEIVDDECYVLQSENNEFVKTSGCTSEKSILVDLNGDGWLDIVVANSAMIMNQIFMQVAGENRFVQQNLSSIDGLETGLQYNSDVFAHDVNADGRLDLILTDGFGSETVLLLQTANGSFIVDRTSHLADFPNQFMTDVDMADFNNDGHPDFLFTSGIGSHILMRNLGNGSFVPDQEFAAVIATIGTLERSRSPGIGDLDGDGFPDIFISTLAFGTKTLLQNLGGNGWRVLSNTSLMTAATPIASTEFVDLNGDGRLDVAMFAGTWDFDAYSGANSPVFVMTFLNWGSFTFEMFPLQQSTLAFPYGFKTVAAALDVDSDGDMDLITSNWGSSWMINTYINDGTGNFSLIEPGTTVPFMNLWYTSGLLTEDIDLDGDMDVIAMGYGSPTIVLTNIAGGLYPTTFLTEAIAAGNGALCDVDGDGKRDLIVARYFMPTVIYLINEVGNFSQVDPVTYPMGGLNGLLFSATSVSCGDYNGDGLDDVFITTANDAAPLPNYLFRNNGNLTFFQVETPEVMESGYSSSASFYDYDADGDLDILIVNTDGEENDLLINTDGEGTFSHAINSVIAASTSSSTVSVWGDFNHDNKDDVLILEESGLHELYMSIGDGKHALSSFGSIAVGGSFKSAVAFDVDGDGDLDIILIRTVDVDSFYRSIFVYENTYDVDPVVEHGSIQVPDIPIGAYVTDYAWTDVTGDNIDDLILLTGSFGTSISAPVVVLQAGSDGSLSVVKDNIVSNIAGNFVGIDAHDMDGDGLSDIYISAADVMTVSRRGNRVLKNLGNGVYEEVTNTTVKGVDTVSTAGTLWFDWDGDGDDDIFVINTLGTMAFYRNDGSWKFTLIPGPWDYLPHVVTRSGITMDYDEDGLMDIFIVTMFDTPNFIFKYHGNFMFSLAMETIITRSKNSALGALQFDYDADGDLDLFVWTMHLNSQYARESEYNRVYINHGRGNWSELTVSPLLDRQTFTGDAVYGDLDGDGRDDLFLANGDIFYSQGESNTLYLGVEGLDRFVAADHWDMLASTSGTAFVTLRTFGSRTYLYFDDNTRNIKSYLLVTCSNFPSQVCDQCPPGMYGVKGRCLPCPRGTYNDKYGESQCFPCESGPYYQNEAGKTSCKLCPSGMYVPDEGAYSRDQCEICPRGTDMNKRAVQFESCPCLPNFYRFTRMGECFACPSDGSAACTDGRLTPSQGHWWNISNSDMVDGPVEILECPLDGACLGGENATCADGHEGTACVSCSDNFFMLYGSCTKCSSPAATIVIAIVIFAVVILIVYILIRSNSEMAKTEVSRLVDFMQKVMKTHEQSEDVTSTPIPIASVKSLLTKDSHRSMTVVSALSQLKIVVAYYQESTALLNVFQDAMPQSYISWAKKFQVTNFDIFTFSSPRCVSDALDFDYLDAYSSSIGLLFFLIFCLFAAWLVRRIQQWYYKVPRVGFVHPESKLSWERYRAFSITCFRLGLFVLYLMYIPISVRVFNVFNCRDLGDESYLEVDYSVECNTSKYHSYEVLSYWMVGIFSLGLPLTVCVLLWYRRRLVTRALALSEEQSDQKEVPDAAMRTMWVPLKERLTATHDNSCFGSNISVFEEKGVPGGRSASTSSIRSNSAMCRGDEGATSTTREAVHPFAQRPSTPPVDHVLNMGTIKCELRGKNGKPVKKLSKAEGASVIFNPKLFEDIPYHGDASAAGHIGGERPLTPSSPIGSTSSHDWNEHVRSASRCGSLDNGEETEPMAVSQPVGIHLPPRLPGVPRVSVQPAAAVEVAIESSGAESAPKLRRSAATPRGPGADGEFRPPLKREQFHWIRFDATVFKARMTSLALGFLYENYRDEAYYWEVFEMLRRLLMTSVIVFLGKTPEGRLLSAICISFASIAIVHTVRPFRRPRDYLLTRLAFLSIFFQLWLSLAILTHILDASMAMAALYSLLNSLLLVVFVFIIFRALRKRYSKLHRKLEAQSTTQGVKKWDVLKAVFAVVNAKTLRKSIKDLTEEGLDIA